MKLQKPTPYSSISATLPVDIKARLLQSADADLRTPSSMLAVLLTRAIPAWWAERGIPEPVIEDPMAWMGNRLKGTKSEE